MAKVHPIINMSANMTEVDRLLAIHGQITGTSRGRRHRVEVLNKSGIVLITACWESCVEDLAIQAFDFLLKQATSPDNFPRKIRVLASRQLKEASDPTRVWELAGDGWRKVLAEYRKSILDKFVGSLNTPRSDNIDKLFADLLDIRQISSSWTWGKRSATRNKKTLDGFIKLRGDIAHRVSTSKSVTKAKVRDYRDFAFCIAVKTSNLVKEEMKKKTGNVPWKNWSFGPVK